MAINWAHRSKIVRAASTASTQFVDVFLEVHRIHEGLLNAATFEAPANPSKHQHRQPDRKATDGYRSQKLGLATRSPVRWHTAVLVCPGLPIAIAPESSLNSGASLSCCSLVLVRTPPSAMSYVRAFHGTGLWLCRGT